MAIIVCISGYIGYSYANELHSQATKEIHANSQKLQAQEKQVAEVVTTLTIVQNTLVSLTSTMGEVKQTVDRTNDRVLDIYKQMYVRKTN